MNNKINKTLILILLSSAVVFSVGIGTVAADPAIIYVNHTSGNDSWDGQYATW